ncbi:hypothetical protein ACFOWU_07815 [Epilithonimonas zeae]|uniref:Uncharacterized protein n=1 Tax=Epilithonimonas zeae TaxID=1416779 RepID=A0A1N6G3Y1_9FLAO|nr:hypothetical protein [Epilithonimonas zeae]SIO02266.1 hypothetical protein SAMN05444409_1638 [Epilithonimonas zeae]
MKSIDTLQDLTKKIFEVTAKIQTLYPELYFLLNETPLFMTQNEKYITSKDLKQYLSSIRIQLITFQKEMKKNKKMKTIILYKFKNSVTQKMPLLKEKSLLSSLNDLMAIDLLDTEIITEYTMDVPEDFNFEYRSNEELLDLCKTSKNFIDHHFVTTLNDYDVI